MSDKFDEVLARLTNVQSLQALLDAAKEMKASAGQIERIKARIEEVTLPSNLDIARRWVNEDVLSLFQAEISNEVDGGVTPATLSSTIDSISQGLTDSIPEGEVVNALIALLVIRDLLPGDTGVRELL